MDVKKIFIILITVVACIAIGAFVLNVFMPNVMAGVFNAIDTAIFDATGIAVDLNGDNTPGSTQLSSTANSKIGTANGTINANGGVGVGGYGDKSKTKSNGK
jgi:hypothetical protein